MHRSFAPRDGAGIENRVDRVGEIELRAGNWRHGVIRVQSDFSEAAVKFLRYAGAEGARYLGVTSSCVTRIASQERRLDELQIRYNIR